MKNTFKKASIFILILTLTVVLVPFSTYAGEFSYNQFIAPKYDNARTFSEGLAAVKKDGKWGYVDKDDKVVIDFKYDIAYSFSENKAIVGIEKEIEEYGEKVTRRYLGVIDKNDNYKDIVVYGEKLYDKDSFLADELQDTDQQTHQLYRNGVVMLQRFDDPGIYMFDKNGKQLFIEESTAYVPTEGVVAVYGGYVDLNGNRLFTDKNFTQTRPFNQGWAAVSFSPLSFSNDGTTNVVYNLMDTKGKLMKGVEMSNFKVSDPYGSYVLFSDNSLLSMANTDGKWGAINKSGTTIVPFKYEELTPFHEGVAGFKKDGKYGYIDINGKEVISPQFDNVSGFRNGIAAVAQGDNAYIIDKKGQKIKGTENLPRDSYFIKDSYGNTVVFSPGDYVLTKENSKYGFAEINYTPSLPTSDEMSTWALKEVTLAIEKDLVPASLQNMYRTDITRVDFAALVVKAIEEVVGEDIDKVVKKETGQNLYDLVDKYPFKDTTDQNVVAAQALKIISGKGEGRFAPYDKISRQESAALLMRTSKFLGHDTKPGNKAFNDHDKISNFAKEAVNYVSSIDIMQGKENNDFSPHDNYTREQAYMTIYRLFNVLVDKK